MKNVNTLDELISTMEEAETEGEANEGNSPAAAVGVSLDREARACLLALVEKVNAERRFGYSEDELKKMANNLFYCCRNQVARDLSGYCNRRSLIHENVVDAAVTMYFLAMDKMDAINIERGNISTFLMTVFNNYCATQYAKRSRDARYYAESLYAPISSDEDALCLGDVISVEDHSYMLQNVAAAKRAAYDFLLKYAAGHMSADEYQIFCLHCVERKSNVALAEELNRDKKSIENACFRALNRLRKEAMPALNNMLRRDYGFRNIDDLLYSSSELNVTEYKLGVVA